MEKCEKDLCETTEQIGKKSETTEKEQEYTEGLHGVIMLRKGKLEEEEVWFGTVGNQLVSDGVYKTKEDVSECLEKCNLETICKIISGAFGRAIELTKTEKK